MKWIKAFFDSCYLSWIGWFGGAIKDKEFYVLWTIKIRHDVEFKVVRCYIVAIRDIDYLFSYLPNPNKEE